MSKKEEKIVEKTTKKGIYSHTNAITKKEKIVLENKKILIDSSNFLVSFYLQYFKGNSELNKVN
jgi:hypothetical protein